MFHVLLASNFVLVQQVRFVFQNHGERKNVESCFRNFYFSQIPTRNHIKLGTVGENRVNIIKSILSVYFHFCLRIFPKGKNYKLREILQERNVYIFMVPKTRILQFYSERTGNSEYLFWQRCQKINIFHSG